MNTLLVLITYTAALAMIAIILYILGHESPFDTIHRRYYISAVFTLSWSISYFVMYLTPDPGVAAAAYRAGCAGWTLNYSLLFLLCMKLIETISGKKVSPIPGYLVILSSLVFFIAALNGEVFATEFTRMPGGWWHEEVRRDNPWVVGYLLWAVTVFTTGIVPLSSMLKRARLKRHRRLIFFIFIPFVSVIVFTILINLIAPIIEESIPPIGHVLVSFYLAFFGYALVKFRVTTPDPGFITGPLLFQISDMVILTDNRGTIVRTNHAVSDLLGYREETLVSADLTKILPGIMPLRQCARECEAIMERGQTLSVHCTVTPIDDRYGDRIGFFLLLKDLTRLKKLRELTKVLKVSNRELEQLSVTDSLTGMFNRSKLKAELIQEILRSRRYGTIFSLILYDVDHFKNINDSHGHAAGDAVLRNMSVAVQASIRETDILGRWGGEEFMIICVNTSLEAAGKLAEKIRSRLEELYHEPVGTVTASFGVTTFMKTDTEDSIIERVDRAMYNAKHRGRNTTSIL